MVFRDERSEFEIGGAEVQLIALRNAHQALTWSVANDRSHLFVNLGGTMRTFEGSSHSRLLLGGPTLGEFSWLPPGAAFTGFYGTGAIRFLTIVAPPAWPAPDWPRLAAFDLRVLEAAQTIARLIEQRRLGGLLDRLRNLWASLLANQRSTDVRRGTELSDRRFEEAQRCVAGAMVRSAQDLAERLGASLDGLNRTFQVRFGMSAARYLDETRLRRARRLMTLTDAPLARIALDAGFASQSHLTVRVRSQLGLSPTALRRLLVRPQ